MKTLILVFLLMMVVSVSSCSFRNETEEAKPYKRDTSSVEEAKPKTNKNLVLVELFTSEG